MAALTSIMIFKMFIILIWPCVIFREIQCQTSILITTQELAVHSTISPSPSSLESVPSLVTSSIIVPSNATKFNLLTSNRRSFRSSIEVSNSTQSFYMSSTQINASMINSHLLQNSRTVKNTNISQISRSLAGNTINTTLISLSSVFPIKQSTTQLLFITTSKLVQASTSRNTSTLNSINISLPNVSTVASSKFITLSNYHSTKNQISSVFISVIHTANASLPSTSSVIIIPSSTPYINSSSMILPTSPYSGSLVLQNKTESLVALSSKTSQSLVQPSMTQHSDSLVLQNKTESLVTLSSKTSQSLVQPSMTQHSDSLVLQNKTESLVTLSSKTSQSLVQSSRTQHSDSLVLQSKTESLVTLSSKTSQSLVQPSMTQRSDSLVLQNKTESLISQSLIQPSMTQHSDSSLSQNKTESLVMLSSKISHSLISPSSTFETVITGIYVSCWVTFQVKMNVTNVTKSTKIAPTVLSRFVNNTNMETVIPSSYVLPSSLPGYTSTPLLSSMSHNISSASQVVVSTLMAADSTKVQYSSRKMNSSKPVKDTKTLSSFLSYSENSIELPSSIHTAKSQIISMSVSTSSSRNTSLWNATISTISKVQDSKLLVFTSSSLFSTNGILVTTTPTVLASFASTGRNLSTSVSLLQSSLMLSRNSTLTSKLAIGKNFSSITLIPSATIDFVNLSTTVVANASSLSVSLKESSPFLTSSVDVSSVIYKDNSSLATRLNVSLSSSLQNRLGTNITQTLDSTTSLVQPQMTATNTMSVKSSGSTLITSSHSAVLLFTRISRNSTITYSINSSNITATSTTTMEKSIIKSSKFDLSTSQLQTSKFSGIEQNLTTQLHASVLLSRSPSIGVNATRTSSVSSSNVIGVKRRRRREVILNNSNDTSSVSFNVNNSTSLSSIFINGNLSANGGSMEATAVLVSTFLGTKTNKLLSTYNQYSSVMISSSYNVTTTLQSSINQTIELGKSSVISLQSTPNNTLIFGILSSTPVATVNYSSSSGQLSVAISVTTSLSNNSSSITKDLSSMKRKTGIKSSISTEASLSSIAENKYLTSTLGLCWIPFTTIVPVTSFSGMVSSMFLYETSKLFTTSSPPSSITVYSFSLHHTQPEHTPFTSNTALHPSSETFVTVISDTIDTLFTSTITIMSGTTYRKSTSIHSLTPRVYSSVLSSIITWDSSYTEKTNLTKQTRSIFPTVTKTRPLLETTKTTVVTQSNSTTQGYYYSTLRETLVTRSSVLQRTITTVDNSSNMITTSKQESYIKGTPSTIAMSSLFSVPSSSSVLIQPTVPPANNNLKLSIIVNEMVDVEGVDFKSSLEQKLVDTYVRMKVLSRFRRSASNGAATVKIIDTTRKGKNVDVEFKVQDNGADVPATQAAAVFNYLSVSGLGKQLGYEVLSLISTVSRSSNYKLTDILGMVLSENRSDYNLSVPANQQDLEIKMVQTYKNLRNYSNIPVSVKIIYIKYELQNTVYIEFYVTVNAAVQNATYIEAAFQDSSTTTLSGELGIQLSSLPYVANGYFSGNREQAVRMVYQPLVSSTDISTPSYKEKLALNIANIYIAGKSLKRKRRAVGSVIAQIEILMSVNTYQVETLFLVRDQGAVQNGKFVSDTMNKISAADMRAILGGVVTTKPEPLVLPPTPATSDPPYWIIAAATVPVVVIALICVLCCWRWKRGGPNPKISPEQIEMEDKVTEKEVANDGEIQKEETAIKDNVQEKVSPVYSPDNTSYIPSDVKRGSQRRKIQSIRNQKLYGRQNQGYDVNDDYEEDIEEEDGDEDESEEETEEEIIIVRKPSPRPKEVEVRRKLDYETVDGRHHGAQYVSPEKPPRPMPRSPVPYQDVQRRPLELTANKMETEGLIRPVHVPVTYTAGQIESFGRMQETRGMTPNPPVRFRTNIENDMEAYTKPTGPLPVLDFHQTSLIAATPKEQIQSVFKAADPDLQHKSEVERIRNKQRQRDQLFGASQNFSRDDQVLLNKNQQDEIDAVLDPVNAKTISDLSQRKSRLRRKLRRKNKIYITPEPKHQQQMKKEDVLLKSYQEFPKEKDMISDKMEDMSEPESDISMREANRRIRALIDDTFTTLKKYKQTLNDPEKGSLPKRNEHIASSTPRRYAGMAPALPDPAPSHGRATTVPPGHGRPREVAPNPFAYPYNNPYGTSLTDPVVTWDPLERQRYINQRMGYPVYGPVASSLTMPYGSPGQNVYMTPLQQRPDGMGGVLWSPYAMNETLGDANAYKTLDSVFTPVPGQNSLPRKPKDDFKMEHATTLDMNDVGSLKKSTSTQPLIRAIKEELLKLSQNAQGKTKITELQQTEAPTAS